MDSYGVSRHARTFRGICGAGETWLNLTQLVVISALMLTPAFYLIGDQTYAWVLLVYRPIVPK